MQKEDASILIVDDDPAICKAARMFLKQLFSQIVTERDPSKVTGLMAEVRFDVILLDMNFSPGRKDGSEGMYWMEQILAYDPGAVVVFVTAYGEIDLAVSAMRSGAFDFIVKPWKNKKLLEVIRRALTLSATRRNAEKYRDRQSILMEDLDQLSGMVIGNSMAMQKVFTTIEKVAPTDASVLLLGENGSGKELIAREIHRQSERKEDVFIGVDLGALHGNLFESELFGHEKGAFTDAGQTRPGRFEVASGGTIFLDEIGNLSVPLQSKLLSVLEKRTVTRLGSSKEIPLDIRLITATNMPLYEMTGRKEFREDLLYRINTVEIRIPPLRERSGDIPQLIDHFVRLYGRKYNKPGVRIPRSIMSRLERYPWPGNVRELRHAVERSVILSEGNTLEFGDLLPALPGQAGKDAPDTLNLSEMEKRYILKAIDKNRGNITRAAADLGLERTALYRRIRKHGL